MHHILFSKSLPAAAFIPHRVTMRDRISLTKKKLGAWGADCTLQPTYIHRFLMFKRHCSWVYMHAPAGRKELGPLEKDLCERIASGVSCWSFRRREFDFCVWRGGWSVCLGVLVFVCVIALRIQVQMLWWSQQDQHMQPLGFKEHQWTIANPKQTPVDCETKFCWMPNLPLHFKEAKGNTTEFTEKLAGYSTGNESRDYFRNNELPVDTCTFIDSEKMFLFSFPLLACYLIQHSWLDPVCQQLA